MVGYGYMLQIKCQLLLWVKIVQEGAEVHILLLLLSCFGDGKINAKGILAFLLHISFL